jgi:chromosome segregation ATPase|tara:strand:+ start:2584 stop:3339 length:756 start_codon:yes stop_codon:yes gene_type:complete
LSKRVEPELPTITIDQDQVKVAREPAIKSQKVHESKHTVKTKKPSSMIKALLLLMPYVALAATAWYFYQQQINVTRSLESSSQRIQQLENQLSATGEEMGESTIALKVKLEAIGEKTELLLSEMDKLWASAWRKNQKEIKELNSTSIKIVQQQDKTIEAMSLQSNTINELKDKITATEFSVNSVSEQIMALNSVKTEIKSLSSALSTLDANAKSRDKQQMFTATTVNEFDTSLQLLLERMERLEAILVSKS